MSENPFEKGQVVYLKSGGPRMTITEIGDDQFGTLSVFCTWFEKDKRMADSFPVESVKLAPMGPIKPGVRGDRMR